ncbi:MAG: DUF1097 domain-containing protein [Propioniciclava sp.]|jgi:hypothetical protein
MTPRRFLPIAIFVALQSSVLQVIDQVLRHAVPPAANLGFTWVAFLAWATYFLAGSTVRGGAKALVGIMIGILYSIGVFVLGGWLGALGFLASPVAILLLIPLVMYLELGPDLVTLVPLVFVGAGTFFACMLYIPGATFATIAATQSIYTLLGLTFGWMTIAFRTAHQKRAAMAPARNDVLQ